MRAVGAFEEHFQLSMSLRQALLVDQVDAYNLLSVEIQFRRLQTIEFSYREKAKELESKADFHWRSRLVLEGLLVNTVPF